MDILLPDGQSRVPSMPRNAGGRVFTVHRDDTIRNHAAFIWSVADLLRGDYKQSEYGKVILPFTVLRRLDCVLEPTRAAVLAEKKKTA